MKTNLSSKIKLEYIPKRYFDPEDEVELATLTQREKVSTKIFETAHEGSEYLADTLVAYINRYLDSKNKCFLALDAAQSLDTTYAALIKRYEEGKVNFANVVVYSLCEFFPQTDESPSTLRRLKEVFLNHVNVKEENIRSFNIGSSKEKMQNCCKAYEQYFAGSGGIDITICEIGASGNIAFNGPGTPATKTCRLVPLDYEMRKTISEDYHCDSVPTTGVTIGMANILASKNIFSVAWGENKAKIIQKTVEEAPNPNVPASFLQYNQNAVVIVDLPAAEYLTRISHPWKVTSCDWNDKLIRRAIVWLCHKTGKPILKLTDKDYNDNGLGELLTQFGSAYNVNIKIFNDLQHTITGWPGGKPNADDTYRPERALPYPKKVLIFSPHPDDDVISMGGTLKRLVDQGHDVHVAYQTSGNIAVGDEDMMRYLLLMDTISSRFGFDTNEFAAMSNEIHEFIKDKNNGDQDIETVRFIKTKIRQGEAKIACKYTGVKPENVHFLNMPFYETGTIKKGDLSEKDLRVVKDLIEEIKPHEIFVAGDLADPHGTHKVCTDAVFAAIDEMKDDEWMKDCRIWMYRGAWAEWEIDHIEMAVPISPEELRSKRNSILKHQSQMENAPFLGNDDRLFWQRAEDRNRATAKLYHDLGLASYEAIEAFVEYHPIRE